MASISYSSPVPAAKAVPTTAWQWVDNTRVIAAFAVVMLHVTAGLVENAPLGGTAWWMGNALDALVRWCVPVFVMISGFLLLNTKKNQAPESLATFYRKRASRILVPLLFWSLFYLVWTALRWQVLGQPMRVGALFEQWAKGMPYYHMWYLHMILGLYLFAPFIKRLLSILSTNEQIFLCVVLFVLSALTTLIRYAFDLPNSLFFLWFLYYLGYFIAGHLLGRLSVKISNLALWAVLIFTIIEVAVGCYYLATLQNLALGFYFYDYTSIAVIPMSLAIFVLLQRMRLPASLAAWMPRLAAVSMGIYLLHPAILDVLSFVGLKWDILPALISVPLISLIAFVLAAIAAFVMSKIPVVRGLI